MKSLSLPLCINSFLGGGGEELASVNRCLQLSACVLLETLPNSVDGHCQSRLKLHGWLEEASGAAAKVDASNNGLFDISKQTESSGDDEG